VNVKRQPVSGCTGGNAPLVRTGASNVDSLQSDAIPTSGSITNIENILWKLPALKQRDSHMLANHPEPTVDHILKT
jgi:hypothetical protein